MGKIIYRDGTGEPRIVIENQLDIFGRALVLAPLVDVHACEPVLGLVVILPLYWGKLLLCLGQSLLADGHLDTRIGSRELLHRSIAWQASRGCPRLRLFVKLPELMDADEVKGVDELAAARVGRVVAVEVLTVLVNHSSRSARACCIGVAVVCGAGVVHAWQECLHRLGDGVGAAERAYDTFFARRVLLLGGGLAYLCMRT